MNGEHGGVRERRGRSENYVNTVLMDKILKNIVSKNNYTDIINLQ